MKGTSRAGRRLDAGLALLDRQILDMDGKACGNVDDLEFAPRDGGGPPYVTAILAGPGALARRIGGRAGDWLESVFERLHHAENPHPARIGFGAVKSIGSHVALSVGREGLEVMDLERWVREHFIGKIPGAFHGSE